jgi:iron complex outermembrane receptor protein
VTKRDAAGNILANQTRQVNAQGATGYSLEFELAAKATPLDTVQLASAIQKTVLVHLGISALRRLPGG